MPVGFLPIWISFIFAVLWPYIRPITWNTFSQRPVIDHKVNKQESVNKNKIYIMPQVGKNNSEECLPLGNVSQVYVALAAAVRTCNWV